MLVWHKRKEKNVGGKCPTNSEIYWMLSNLCRLRKIRSCWEFFLLNWPDRATGERWLPPESPEVWSEQGRLQEQLRQAFKEEKNDCKTFMEQWSPLFPQRMNELQLQDKLSLLQSFSDFSDLQLYVYLYFRRKKSFIFYFYSKVKDGELMQKCLTNKIK